MLAVLAAAPILAAAGLILLRQSAVKAGMAGLVITVTIVVWVPAFQLSSTALADAFFKGGLTTVTVAYVLFGGVLLYQVLREGGALKTVSAAVTCAIPDPAHRLFTLVLGFSVFLEAVTGFGIGIVVCAPLFVAFGCEPRRAALLALLGQCAIPWGALGIGTLLGSRLSGVPVRELGTLGAVLSFPFIVLCGAIALAVAGEWRPMPKRVVQLAFYASTLAAVLWAGSILIGVELAGCLAGLVVIAVGLASGAIRPSSVRPAAPTKGQLGPALIPMAVLVGSLLATRLWPTLENWSRSTLRVDVERFDFTLSVLHHPGFWMIVAAGIGVATLGLSRQRFAAVAAATIRQWAVATLAVSGFLILAQIMFDASMTNLLAATITGAFGHRYLLLIPWVGALSGFLTASNAGANAMFMQFQASAAQTLSLPLELAAAAQNAGAANATLASPGRIALAAAVTGCAGQEHRLLRPALLVVLGGTAAMTLVLAWMAA